MLLFSTAASVRTPGRTNHAYLLMLMIIPVCVGKRAPGTAFLISRQVLSIHPGLTGVFSHVAGSRHY